MYENFIKYICKFEIVRKYLKFAYYYIGYYEQKLKCEYISPDYSVLSGPFKGLKYNTLRSVGSELIPKFIGSYEDELHTIVEEVIANEPKTVIDIGCAEGYYANGFAKRLIDSKIHAYDTSPLGQKLCMDMARLNQVEDRVVVKSTFVKKEFDNYNLKDNVFILCDCEGFEKEIFTKETVAKLSNCMILIELHDLIDDTISDAILPLFEASHELKLVKSNNKKKLKDYFFINNNKELLNDDDLIERMNIIMYWAFLRPKQNI